MGSRTHGIWPDGKLRASRPDRRLTTTQGVQKPAPFTAIVCVEQGKTFVKMFVLSLMLLLAPVANAEEASAIVATEPTYEVSATGEIEIGPTGSVHRYKLDEGQPLAIERALARSIAKWRFEPVTVDGRPVIAATRIRMRIMAEPTASGDYQLRVAGVWFGEPEGRHHLTPPSYPMDALGAEIEAQVVLVLKLDERGRVTRRHAERVSLDRPATSERIAEHWRKVFTDASMAAAKRWRFDISEIVDGAPVGTSIRIPIAFSIRDGLGNSDNTWNSYVPGPYHPIPWSTDSAVADIDADSERLREGDVRSLNSRFRLTTEVVDTLL